MDEGVGGCLLGTVIVSVGIWWLLASYWPIILGIVLVVVLVMALLALWPKPDTLRTRSTKRRAMLKRALAKLGKHIAIELII